MMKIPFWKMQGTGNDFIVIDNMALGFTQAQLQTLAKRVCRSHFSVGSDAVMALDSPQYAGDVRMRFYNADGTEAEMCGNGARCLARYAYEKGLAPASMKIETLAGLVPAWRLDERNYKVQLNSPSKVASDLKYVKDGIKKVDYCELGEPGVPHLVVHYPELATTDGKDLVEIAQRLRFWKRLPKGANVNFYALLPNREVLLRTFERGVEGFTYACGTGAGSTAYLLYQKKLLLNNKITLHTLGGLLEVEIKENELFLSGATTVVVEGAICDEDLEL